MSGHTLKIEIEVLGDRAAEDLTDDEKRQCDALATMMAETIHFVIEGAQRHDLTPARVLPNLVLVALQLAHRQGCLHSALTAIANFMEREGLADDDDPGEAVH